MEIRLLRSASKYIAKLNEPIKSKILDGIKKLENDPPQGDIKTLSGQDGYRLRIGNYRILFEIRNNNIEISNIGLRGQIYKRK
ncbi:MAG: type II toxin-antitoxin system RelE/ParE family toxin [Clostridiales bacterium]|jgi:mRNA interferase RelE/StbE|nr:type II toxin-antitoxin system RelE/ParE family toxin [Clostridiales bacterium]